MQGSRTRLQQLYFGRSLRANVCIAAAAVYLICLTITFICHFWPKTVKCGIVVNELQSFIFNGSVAPLGFVPWYVSLKVKESRIPNCGATIISQKWIITAKHCALLCRAVKNVDCLIVVAGSQHAYDHTGGSVHKVVEYIPYDNPYDIGVNDIALMKVYPSFKWQTSELHGNKRGIAPVCLPNFEEKISENEAVASGFGLSNEFHALKPKYLTTVKQKIYAMDFCNKIMRNPEVGPKICAGNIEERKSTCGGDSGGPLTVMRENRATLVGVAHSGDVKGCERGGIFMDVAAFRKWIKTHADV